LKLKSGWGVVLTFGINLHKKDEALLKNLQIYFNNIGTIADREEGVVKFSVSSITDLENIINHFNSYPLISQKWSDYQLFKQAFELVKCKKHLTLSGLKEIVSIKASLNKGLSEELKVAFPNVIPVLRPIVLSQEIKDPYWLSGFINAEGSFYIVFSKSLNSALREKVTVRFSIAQHSRDEALIRSIIEYLGCGNVYTRSGGRAVDFKITSLDNLINKLIPFFEMYPMIGSKSLDFLCWCKVANLIKNKIHLTSIGLEEIREINKEMNLRRK